MKTKAFTLIEILVVIAIIMILAAIFFPVLASARRKAQEARCALQLRQIGVAIRMYADDHDSLPPQGGYNLVPQSPSSGPPTTNQPPSAGVRMTWQDILLQTNYLRDDHILICPITGGSYPELAYLSSYGVNGWIMHWNSALSMDMIPSPSKTLLATEKVGYDWVAWPPDAAANNPFYMPLDPRHEGRLNVLFADGHVSTVGIGELIEGPRIIWRL